MTQKHSVPQRRLLSVALLLALAHPGWALAQEAEDDAAAAEEDEATELDAVVVTGIRGSLTSSLNV